MCRRFVLYRIVLRGRYCVPILSLLAEILIGRTVLHGDKQYLPLLLLEKTSVGQFMRRSAHSAVAVGLLVPLDGFHHGAINKSVCGLPVLLSVGFNDLF